MRSQSREVTATDTLFVTVFHNLPGISAGEEIDYYTPGDRERLQRGLLSAAEHYFTLFSESYEYGDPFDFAVYDIPEDCFDEAELDTFRSALDPDERERRLSDLHPRNIFDGYRAVVYRRISSSDLAICQQGIELFNLVMECALPTDDKSNPRCYIKLETAKEFAPAFLDDLLETVRARERGNKRYEATVFGFPRHLGEVLQPLQPLLTMLAKMVSNEAWPQSDLALGKFLLLADYYRGLLRDWYGEAQL